LPGNQTMKDGGWWGPRAESAQGGHRHRGGGQAEGRHRDRGGGQAHLQMAQASGGGGYQAAAHQTSTETEDKKKLRIIYHAQRRFRTVLNGIYFNLNFNTLVQRMLNVVSPPPCCGPTLLLMGVRHNCC
jgi:hypothetical protein